VGDGGTVNGIDENNTVASYEQLQNIHLAPYYTAIADSVSTVMISYSSWNGVKMSANEYLITTVLKEQMGFQVKTPRVHSNRRFGSSTEDLD
jgi:beta-glucosidase